jgi:hypothetical protein
VDEAVSDPRAVDCPARRLNEEDSHLCGYWRLAGQPTAVESAEHHERIVKVRKMPVADGGGFRAQHGDARSLAALDLGFRASGEVLLDGDQAPGETPASDTDVPLHPLWILGVVRGRTATPPPLIPPRT